MGERRDEKMKEMVRFKKSISKAYGIEKLVLFGSAARTKFKNKPSIVKIALDEGVEI